MTDVSQMPAGRDLDQLVSDAVFGPWEEGRCRVCGWQLEPDGDGCWKDNCSLRPPPARRADEPQPYSTDIAAAWEIITKLHRDATTYFQIEWSRSRWEAVIRTTRYGSWSAEGGEMDGFLGEAQANTAPLAICRAALEMLGKAAR